MLHSEKNVGPIRLKQWAKLHDARGKASPKTNDSHGRDFTNVRPVCDSNRRSAAGLCRTDQSAHYGTDRHDGVERLLFRCAQVRVISAVGSLGSCPAGSGSGLERNGSVERGAGVRCGRPHAAHVSASFACGTHDAGTRGHNWIGIHSRRRTLPRPLCESADRSAGSVDRAGLSSRLYSTQTDIAHLYLRGCISGRDASGSRMDRRPRKSRNRDPDSFRRHVRLAVSTLSIHCLALSRGLRARRHPHAAGGRAGWAIHGVANSGVLGRAHSGEHSAGCNWNDRTRVSGRGASHGRGALPGFIGNGASAITGDGGRIQNAGPALAARNDSLPAVAVRLDDGQLGELRVGKSPWPKSTTLVEPGHTLPPRKVSESCNLLKTNLQLPLFGMALTLHYQGRRSPARAEVTCETQTDSKLGRTPDLDYQRRQRPSGNRASANGSGADRVGANGTGA